MQKATGDIRATNFIAGAEIPDPTISSVLLELQATWDRLERSPTRLRGGKAVIHAVALAEEVDCVCYQLSVLNDAFEVKRLLLIATNRLHELQKLIGVH